MNIQTVYGLFTRRFRPARARDIANRFPLLADPSARILDVGGDVYPWNELNPAARVTILNISPPRSIPNNNQFEFVVGTGTDLQYPDGSFDLVFSNSVIEHVGDLLAQEQFAREALRVGKRVYCQTPNKWFPIEPHFIAIFIHWLPFPIARKLVRFGTIWGWVNKPSQEVIDSYLSTIRLLTMRELVGLFPGCTLRRERVLGLTKSFIIEKL